MTSTSSSVSTIDNSSGFSSQTSRDTARYVTPRTWLNEFNYIKQSCIVYLYRRYIGLVVAYHWALTFEWEDGYQATYEAVDQNGTLTARWKRGEVDEKSDDGIKYHWYLWDTYEANNCSPIQVNATAKSLRIGDMLYDALSTNCHEWATALAKFFGVTLPSGLPSILRGSLKGNGNIDYDPALRVGISRYVERFLNNN